MSQPDRLKALLLDPKRPVQLIFAAGPPADDLGKEMIRQTVQFARDPTVRHRIGFIEDYNIAVARMLIQGCDVWLNNPRRPMEASGTSGEKSALNGGLNLSVLDGWWDEMFDGKNGWQIASAESYGDLQRRDEVEANSLFEILERQVVPLYYDRGGDRFPRQWVARIKDSFSSLGRKVQASRMVREYVPAHVRANGKTSRHPERQGLRRSQGPGRVETPGCRRLEQGGCPVGGHRLDHAGDRPGDNEARHGRSVPGRTEPL